MKDYDKNKEASYLQYWDLNNSCGWIISQTFPVNNFKWFEYIFEFDESFSKIITKKVMKDVFLDLTFNIPKICLTFTIIYRFFLKEQKLKK